VGFASSQKIPQGSKLEYFCTELAKPHANQYTFTSTVHLIKSNHVSARPPKTPQQGHWYSLFRLLVKNGILCGSTSKTLPFFNRPQVNTKWPTSFTYYSVVFFMLHNQLWCRISIIRGFKQKGFSFFIYKHDLLDENDMLTYKQHL